MRSWVLAAGLLAAAVTTGHRPPISTTGRRRDRYGSAYEDPRYADIYKYPKGRRPARHAGAYGRPYAGPPALCRPADPARARLSRRRVRQ